MLLAVSPITSNKDGHKREAEATMDTNFTLGSDDFLDFSAGNLLDSIDFDDLYMGMQDEDLLPDLEMDPELLVEFSFSGREESDGNNSSVDNNSPNDDGHVGFLYHGEDNHNEEDVRMCEKRKRHEERKFPREQEIQSKKVQESEFTTTLNSLVKEDEQRKKLSSLHNSSSNNNNNQGKRKPKVDWTPELHRRFVQAVEQLGVDKAVPSRILELMGIDCLTRHNIASHLQKYRSHRKHLLVREAEAASWTQKRQMYGVAVGGGKGGRTNVLNPWHPPMMGFPPTTTMHPPFRPLHVWGHPSMDAQARMPMWPNQVVATATLPLPSMWTPPPPHPPNVDPSFWHSSHHQRRFTAPPVLVPGIPPHAMYRTEPASLPLPHARAPQPGLELLPSKESIDAAIGDALAKPWLPLPIGLKPPSTDSVLVELQRQGISKVPPTSPCP